MRRWALIAVLAGLALPASARAGQPAIVRPLQPAGAPLALGEQLYAGNCLRCHGISGRGIDAGPDGVQQGPSLRGVGALAPDFYLSTGYMPISNAKDQPLREPSQLSVRERQALVQYVASLGSGPPVPAPHPESGDVASGRELFTEHCSGCHQVAASGGIMTGAKAPPLDRATPVQVAEAVRIGPYVMPKFSTRDISDAELNSIIAYVEYMKNPQDEGGWGIDHLGPFPEGMVTWFLAVVVLLGTCIAIGKRGVRP